MALKCLPIVIFDGSMTTNAKLLSHNSSSDCVVLSVVGWGGYTGSITVQGSPGGGEDDANWTAIYRENGNALVFTTNESVLLDSMDHIVRLVYNDLNPVPETMRGVVR
jgi:hypothetical protein